MVDKARETVNRQVRLLARLLDDLLEVSRITRGTVELRKQPVNITTSVANALDATRSFIDAREHALTVSVPEQPLVLDADPMRIEQIITNLVLNAAKYTPPKGTVVVSASRQHDDAVIRVRDNGIGIPGDLLPRVFDMFTQGDRSLAHSGGGLGVGLTIVKKLVELHGGTITVESEGPGRGSEFTVRLPIRPPVQDVAPVKSAAVPESPDRTGAHPRGGGQSRQPRDAQGAAGSLLAIRSGLRTTGREPSRRPAFIAPISR